MLNKLDIVDKISLIGFFIMCTALVRGWSEWIIIVISAFVTILLFLDIFYNQYFYQKKRNCSMQQMALMKSLGIKELEEFFIQHVKNGKFYTYKFVENKLLEYDEETHRFILSPQSTTFKLIYDKKTIKRENDVLMISFSKD